MQTKTNPNPNDTDNDTQERGANLPPTRQEVARGGNINTPTQTKRGKGLEITAPALNRKYEKLMFDN